MKIYLVSQGNDYHGTSVKAAFRSLDDAISHAESLKDEDELERYEHESHIILRYQLDEIITITSTDLL